MSSVFISLVSGIALSLAFPKANLYPVAWVAISPLMYYASRLSWGRALLCGFAFGMGFFVSLLYWIGLFGAFPLILLAMIQTSFFLLFVLAVKWPGPRLGPWGRLVLLPCAWLAAEWLRSFGTYGVAWGLIGNSQYKLVPIIQIAGLTGVWGVTFLLAVSNAALANLAIALKASRRIGLAWAQMGLVVVLAIGVFAFGTLSMRSFESEGRSIRAAVVQGNVDQTRGRDSVHRTEICETYQAMTREAGREGADLVIWPEGVIPGSLNTDYWFQGRLSRLASETGAHILVGSKFHAGGDSYNASYLINPRNMNMERYDKVHLVPFGEFVPARGHLPFLHRYRVTEMDVSRGSRFNVLNADTYKIGTAICFESIFPYISRELTLTGAEVLCVITNDAWFRGTAAAEQHMAASVFRAVENDRYVLRSAATGVSCIIDPCGRILERIELFEEAYVLEDVCLRGDLTVFTRHGDWFVGASVALAAVLGLFCRVRRGGISRRR